MYMYMYTYMAADHESIKLLGILLIEHYNNKRVGSIAWINRR
jgi:hypothetical protein